MATIPAWLLGKHLTSVVLTGQTNTAGNLADSTVKTLTTVIDNIRLSLTPGTEEISAVNTVIDNMVIISDNYGLSLSVIEVNNASDPDPLAALVVAFDYIKVVFTRGTVVGSIETWSAIFTRGALETGITGKGKQVASLELLSAQVSSAPTLRAVS
jgi:hypothetical protein